MSTDRPSGPASGMRPAVANLLRKEWLVFRLRDRFVVLGIYFLAALQAVAVDEVYFFLGIALTATLAVWVPVVEWYQEADPMLFSLPVRRDAVVFARYLATVVYGGVGGLVWSATGRVLLPVLYSARENPPFWMSLEGGLAFFTAFGLLVVLFFPLFFRFGAGKGSLVFLVSSLGLLVLGYATAGLAAGPAAEGGAGLVLPSTLIRTRVSALLDSVGIAGTITVVLLGMALLFGVSIRLSQHILRHREL